MTALRRASVFLIVAGLLAVTASGDAPAQTKTRTGPKAAESAAAPALSFHIYKDAGGKYRFRLKDSSDASLAISTTGHEAKADVQKIIDSIMAGAGKAKVVDDAK
ncbi:MAG TPA: DUF1508 domain-containing protein [Gemmataceae bacterium]|nr:DUF1508 domain-containing protein [Gemmataceae bacterium]